MGKQLHPQDTKIATQMRKDQEELEKLQKEVNKYGIHN